MDNFTTIASGAGSLNHENWIIKSKTSAKEFRLLSHYFARSNSKLSYETGHNIFELLHGISEWTKQAATFIKAEVQAKRKNTYLGAKLIVSSSQDKHNLLTTAIMLGRAGYKELAICATVQTLSLEDLHSEELLEATLAALEPLTSEFDTEKTQTNFLREHPHLLHELAFNKQVSKILNIALLNHNGNASRGDLLFELNQLANISISNKDKYTSIAGYTHQEALVYATERRQRRKNESKKLAKPVIRTIHHLACTGGTLISKCLASMPDVALVSEINPFNRSGSRFEPTNPFLLFERSTSNLSEEDIKHNFKSQIQHIVDLCQRDDLDLILRDHSHTDFCNEQPFKTCPVNDYLNDDYELVSVVSVRHPLDSFLSLTNAGWDKHFRPNTLTEYSKRYLAFLQKYNSLSIIKYEEFCAKPTEIMMELCRTLQINFLGGFEDRFGQHRLSGDSGRTGLAKIEARPRSTVPEVIANETINSQPYIELLEKLGYTH